MDNVLPGNSLVIPEASIPVAGSSSSLAINNLENCNSCEKSINDDSTENFQIIPLDVMSEELHIEKNARPIENRFPIEGKRIVDLSYVLNWAVDFGLEHSRICTGGKLHLLKEQRDGLMTILIFECDVCPRSYRKHTTKPDEKPNLNEAVTWGTLATGSTYGHSEELFTLADIAFMARCKFQKIEIKLSENWKEYLWLSMEKAGLEEKNEAIKRNQINEDNIPWITVFADGGWSKRSYGHNYDAKSGAVIIGIFTKQILFLGIRNKYCSVCARASKKATEAEKHICFKNWEGSSSAMEADILVEGIRLSEVMHNVQYKQFVGDGDSSVYARLRENVLYGRTITKVECTNHIVKNYGKVLYSLANETKFSQATRKFVNNKYIERLEAAVKGAITQNSINKNINELRVDLQNGPYHIFGKHDNCKDYYCKRDKSEPDHTEYLKDSGLWTHIISALDVVVRKANRLIHNQTNNYSENYMNIVSRFNSGKRLNLILRRSLENRCNLAGLRYNAGVKWHIGPWQNSFGCSSGKVLNRYLNKELRSSNQRKTRRQLFSERNLRFKVNSKVIATKDKHYGLNTDDVELEGEELYIECERKLQSLQVSNISRDKIANATIGQFGNPVYENERKDRLTASMFGKIIRKRPSTSCHGLVKATLYSTNIDNKDLKYGRVNEKIAIALFTKKFNLIVEPSAGLHIDITHGFLAASPDGLIGIDSLVEVKCVPSVARKNITLEEATKQIKSFFLEVVDGELHLKRNHMYYYQVQGQLNICQRQICYFVVLINEDKDIFVKGIKRDQQFWLNEMLPHLCTFYKECILPEIVLKRVPRGKPCKDSATIQQAKDIYENKQATKKKKNDINLLVNR